MPNPLMDDVDDCLVGWLFVWLAGLLVIWLVGSCLFGLVWFDHMRANGIQLISVGQLASWNFSDTGAGSQTQQILTNLQNAVTQLPDEQ